MLTVYIVVSSLSASLRRHLVNDTETRVLSSAGRAPDLHSGGQRFDPVRIHTFWIGDFGVSIGFLIGNPQSEIENRLVP
jgi:hypothetical protein